MLSDQLLTMLRQELNSYLNDVCEIQAIKDEQGSMGEAVQSWETIANNVPCRLIRAGTDNVANTLLAGNQEIAMDRYKLILPFGTVIELGYKVIVGTADYLVTGVVENRTAQIDTQAIVKRER